MKRAFKNSSDKKDQKPQVQSNAVDNFELNELKTGRLENFVKANRDEFDFREPSADVWNKINTETKKTKVISMSHYLTRVAAVVAVVAISSVLLWQSGVVSPNRLAQKNADPELLELMEAEAYYSHQVDKKLKEIQKCYHTVPELKDDIETDLTELEDMYRVLKTDLKDNISNKSVIEAMIENNRFRLKLCDNVLEQINC